MLVEGGAQGGGREVVRADKVVFGAKRLYSRAPQHQRPGQKSQVC